MGGKDATETVGADAAGIARAVAALRAGQPVALPTETVYGLAARADDPAAVARIYAAKGRPSFNPLIVHVPGVERAQRYVALEGVAATLARRAWPGPLTLVLPLRTDAGLAPAVTAGLPTVALRAPAHPVMRAVLEQCDFPLAAPSANRSGFISPTSAAHVRASLAGRIGLIVDGGPDGCGAGLESTILAIRADGAWDELRPGPVDLAELHRELTGRPLAASAPRDRIEAPGQMTSHYAPGKPMRLNAVRAAAHEFHLGFGPVAGDWSLSPVGDPVEAAARLYAGLHVAAADPRARIAVAPVPDEGIGRAVNDRLRRAAAPVE